MLVILQGTDSLKSFPGLILSPSDLQAEFLFFISGQRAGLELAGLELSRGSCGAGREPGSAVPGCLGLLQLTPMLSQPGASLSDAPRVRCCLVDSQMDPPGRVFRNEQKPDPILPLNFEPENGKKSCSKIGCKLLYAGHNVKE